ncbi:HlyC/CorC family transporter [Teredinibacter sp. KSP-S5-2]|uniref:HlyC/CorC family transporter n=1 Tax=Teredinibacter sp. KSP-S5-2 TaxID=3034506 RepID=UPI0029350F41|nr:HlyC/CorC family transporter [Teredinibacter sp. KSP-S5-2]WNO10116.1 HlyC/CorC family transporter [Teredinibacter sp. KSP-S5-2]
MDNISTNLLILILVLLIFLSAFFSSSETGMLSLNRYRLRHLVNKGHKGAIRSSALLNRTDRLIGVILIGNNLVNIFATIVAGLIAERLFGEWFALTVMPLLLTLIILIFAEVTPKSVAAAFPEKVAFPASMVLQALLLPLYPVVLLINAISNAIARIFGLDTSKVKLTDHLHPEELRTVVDEAGDLIPDHHQGMLLNILDLENATVEDIMIPRNDVQGIDLEDSIEEIAETLQNTEYTRLPVYEGDINNVIGILHLRKVARFSLDGELKITHEAIRNHLSPPYFIPESTTLPMQLMNFQKEKQRTAIIVDEYGEVKGIATLVDLLEEIVGDFATDTSEEEHDEILEQPDNWFLIDAAASIRDINKSLGWELPTDGPKTLNGLIVEFLEHIPDALVSFEIGHYRFEIKELGDNRIEKAMVLEKYDLESN